MCWLENVWTDMYYFENRLPGLCHFETVWRWAGPDGFAGEVKLCLFGILLTMAGFPFSLKKGNM